MSEGSNLLLDLTGFIGALAAFLEADYCFPFFLFKISFYLFCFLPEASLGLPEFLLQSLVWDHFFQPKELHRLWQILPGWEGAFSTG